MYQRYARCIWRKRTRLLDEPSLLYCLLGNDRRKGSNVTPLLSRLGMSDTKGFSSNVFLDIRFAFLTFLWLYTTKGFMNILAAEVQCVFDFWLVSGLVATKFLWLDLVAEPSRTQAAT